MINAYLNQGFKVYNDSAIYLKNLLKILPHFIMGDVVNPVSINLKISLEQNLFQCNLYHVSINRINT